MSSPLHSSSLDGCAPWLCFCDVVKFLIRDLLWPSELENFPEEISLEDIYDFFKFVVESP